MAEVVSDNTSETGTSYSNAHVARWEVAHDPNTANDSEGLAAVPTRGKLACDLEFAVASG